MTALVGIDYWGRQRQEQSIDALLSWSLYECAFIDAPFIDALS
jgi:hypothetical protein